MARAARAPAWSSSPRSLSSSHWGRRNLGGRRRRVPGCDYHRLGRRMRSPMRADYPARMDSSHLVACSLARRCPLRKRVARHGESVRPRRAEESSRAHGAFGHPVASTGLAGDLPPRSRSRRRRPPTRTRARGAGRPRGGERSCAAPTMRAEPGCMRIHAPGRASTAVITRQRSDFERGCFTLDRRDEEGVPGGSVPRPTRRRPQWPHRAGEQPARSPRQPDRLGGSRRAFLLGRGATPRCSSARRTWVPRRPCR